MQKKLSPNAMICAMVKANAYGVGIDSAVAVLKDKVDFFGVSNLQEAESVIRLCDNKILICGAIDKNNKINPRFSYACSSVDDIEFLKSQKGKINVHLKINSGMNRYGFSAIKDFKLALKSLENSNLHLEGVFTHFATHGEGIETQTKNFLKYVKFAKSKGFDFITHADSSFSSLTVNHRFDMIRVGYNLFVSNLFGFHSPVEISTKVVQINKVKKGQLVGYEKVMDKSTTIAVLPIGYADGMLTNFVGLDLVIGNEKCKIINVCMDCCMIDIGKMKIKKGQEIFILNISNPLSNYAEYLKTNEYQILTLFSSVRAERILKD